VHHRRAQVVVAMDGIVGVAMIGLDEGRFGARAARVVSAACRPIRPI